MQGLWARPPASPSSFPVHCKHLGPLQKHGEIGPALDSVHFPILPLPGVEEPWPRCTRGSLITLLRPICAVPSARSYSC